MLLTNHKLYEALILAAVVSPIEIANSEKVTGAVDMSKFERVIAILTLGNMGNATVDFRLESDSASAFNVDKQTVVAATQLAAPGSPATANDNKQIILEAAGHDLKAGHRYLRGRTIGGSANTGPGAVVILGIPKATGNPTNPASVVQTKAAS